ARRRRARPAPPRAAAFAGGGESGAALEAATASPTNGDRGNEGSPSSSLRSHPLVTRPTLPRRLPGGLFWPLGGREPGRRLLRVGLLGRRRLAPDAAYGVEVLRAACHFLVVEVEDVEAVDPAAGLAAAILACLDARDELAPRPVLLEVDPQLLGAFDILLGLEAQRVGQETQPRLREAALVAQEKRVTVLAPRADDLFHIAAV